MALDKKELSDSQIQAIEEFENIAFWVLGTSDQGSGWMPGLCIGCGKYTYVYTDDYYEVEELPEDFGEMGHCRYSKGYFRCEELHQIKKERFEVESFDPCI